MIDKKIKLSVDQRSLDSLNDHNVDLDDVFYALASPLVLLDFGKTTTESGLIIRKKTYIGSVNSRTLLIVLSEEPSTQDYLITAYFPNKKRIDDEYNQRSKIDYDKS